jgi:membrane-bound lytic murein transglycosylase D
MTSWRLRMSLACALLSPALAMAAQEIPRTPPRISTGTTTTVDAALTTQAPAPFDATATRSGRDIYARFRSGLADPECPSNGGSARWRQHFANAPKRMATEGDDVLPLFGYVVDALRAEHLPTEYALIPFVESGYRPGARSQGGPAGLWQFIALTARNHDVAVRAGYDGRLSPIDSTRAAVRYLKTLHGMFAGDWRLAVMAYNAGEYRVLGALRRSGQNARNAKPETLVGLSPITHAYVQKLRALSCLLESADDREEWLRALDRPIPLLEARTLPQGATTLEAWARTQGLDAAKLKRMNPAFEGGRILARKDDAAWRVLAPVATAEIDGAATAVGATAAGP